MTKHFFYLYIYIYPVLALHGTISLVYIFKYSIIYSAFRSCYAQSASGNSGRNMHCDIATFEVWPRPSRWWRKIKDKIREFVDIHCIWLINTISYSINFCDLFISIHILFDNALSNVVATSWQRCADVKTTSWNALYDVVATSWQRRETTCIWRCDNVVVTLCWRRNNVGKCIMLRWSNVMITSWNYLPTTLWKRRCNVVLTSKQRRAMR